MNETTKTPNGTPRTAAVEKQPELIGSAILAEGVVFPHTGVGRLMEVTRATNVAVHYRIAGEAGPAWVLGRTDFLKMFGKDLIEGHPYTPISENFK